GRVSPGEVSVVYDDFNGGSTFTPPLDLIRYNNVSNGGSTATFFGTTGPIRDGIHPASGNDIPVSTDFPADVNIPDPAFTAITKLDVAVNIKDPNLDNLELE